MQRLKARKDEAAGRFREGFYTRLYYGKRLQKK
jgi:hypothetical protein